MSELARSWSDGRMDIRKRFGHLVAANRRRTGLTQDELARAIDMSPDMVSRIETGKTGARFATIEKLAAQLGVDPAEFFLAHSTDQLSDQTTMNDIVARLSGLSNAELLWVERLLEVALDTRS
jgi:transcriptional regulator with XRE-family HTH domain